MNNRALDSNNDLLLAGSQIARVTEGAQVVQRVGSRLRFYEGEGIFDISEGTPWLQSIMGKPYDLALTEALLKARIIETPGVDILNKFELTFDKSTRGMTITWTATTIYGVVDGNLYINV